MILVDEVPFVLKSSNLVDDPVLTWESETNYDENAVVMSGDYIYRSITQDNQGNNPYVTPLYWQLIGIKNSKAMFDNTYIHLQTSAQEKISLSIEATGADVIMVGGVEANKIIIKQYKSNEIFKIYEENMGEWKGKSFREYVFEPVKKKDRAFFLLSPIINQQIDIEIQKSGGMAKCAYITIGKRVDIGKTLSFGQISLEDFSKIDRNKEGILYLKPGKVVEDGRYTVVTPTKAIAQIKTKIKERRAKATVFLPTCLSTTAIYGFIKEFSPTIGSQTTEYTIEIEEI